MSFGPSYEPVTDSYLDLYNEVTKKSFLFFIS